MGAAMAGRNAINVLIRLLGGKEMEAELKQLGKEGEAAFRAVGEAANKVNLAKFGGALNKFGSDLATVATRASLAVAGIATAAAAVAPAIIAIANAGAEAADQVGKAAQATGLQVEAYQKLTYAAEQAGTGQERFATAMSKFNREIVEAADKATKGGKAIGQGVKQGIGFTTQAFEQAGVTVTRFGDKVAAGTGKATKSAGETRSAFEQLGISLRNSNGTLKSNEVLLRQVADAFAKLPDGARKSALATTLFGEAGAKLIPFLNAGSKGLDELGREAERLGLIFGRDQIKIAGAYRDSLESLQKTASALRSQLGLIFVPALTQAANAFRNMIEQNRRSILAFAEGAVKRTVELVKDLVLALSGEDANVQNRWILDWRDAIVQFGRDFTAVVQGVVLPAFGLIRDAAGLVTDALNAIFGTNFTAGQAALLAGIVSLVGGFRLLASTIGVAVSAARLLFGLALANPWVAALTVVAGGLLLWATRADAATNAMERHKGLVDDVAGAYARAGSQVANMTKEVKDRLFVETTDAANKMKEAIASTFDSASGELFIARQNEVFGALIQNFIDGKVAATDFINQVSAIGRAQPELASVAQEITNVVKPLEELTKKQTFNTDFLDLLAGKLSDAEFQARQAGEGIGTLGTAANQVATDIQAVGTAADDAAAKTENLNRTITVTKFGADGPVKQVFELVNGVARAVDQSKTQLDTLGQSAAQAGAAIQGVSAEVAGAVSAVPESIQPDAAAAAVDSVIADVDRIAPAAQEAAGGINAAFADVGNIDATGAAQAAAAIVKPFQDLAARIDQIFAGLRQLVQSGFSSIASTVSQIASQIEAAIGRILAALQRAAAEAARLRASASSSSSSSSRVSPRNGFAGGGDVRGPGTGTSDSILAWLSNGEFVIRAAVVRKLGVGFFDALNRGILPSLKDLKGFNMGGIVNGFTSRLTSLDIPRLASGGAVDFAVAPSGGGRPINLSIGGETFAVIAPEDVARKMQRFAAGKASTSAGRRPGWYK